MPGCSATSPPAGGRAACRSAPTAARCMSPTRVDAAPGRTTRREPVAEIQRARHRQHHPHAGRASARRLHCARLQEQWFQRRRRRPGPGPGSRDPDNPIPSRPGEASSRIKHVVFINKENATHDLLLGDITATRGGVPVDGEPAFSLGYAASPNHHELALRCSRSATTSSWSRRSRRTATAG